MLVRCETLVYCRLLTYLSKYNANLLEKFVLCVIYLAVSYEDQLCLFGLERLELHRLRYDFIEMFTIFNHFTDCSIYKILSFNCNNNRGHRFKLATVRCDKNIYKHFY